MLAALLASCSKEAEMCTDGAIMATLESPAQTKVTITDPEPGSTTGYFSWSDDTKIAIFTSFNGGTYYYADMEEKSADGKTATFRPNLAGTRCGYAVHPYLDADVDYPGTGGKALRINWQRERFITMEGNRIAAKYATEVDMPMVAENNPGSSNLAFKHLGSILRLHIDHLPSNTRYIRIKSGDTDPCLSGAFIVDWNGGNPLLTPVDGETQHIVDYMFLTDIFTTTNGAVNGLVLNVPIPPGTYDNLIVEAMRKSSSYNQDDYARWECDPITLTRGQAIDVEIPFNNTYKNKGGIYVKTAPTLNTLLTPTVVEYYFVRHTDPNSGSDGPNWEGRIETVCSVEDPSVAQVYVEIDEAYYSIYKEPKITVYGVSPGSTTMHIWARYPWTNDVMYGTTTITVNASPTFSIITDKGRSSMQTGETLALSISSVPEGAGLRSLSYTWEIKSRSGASDAAIASTDGPYAVLSAGTEKGSVTLTCKATYPGKPTFTSEELTLPIAGQTPAGALKGVFRVSATKLVHMARSNLYFDKNAGGGAGLYKMARHQYDVYYAQNPGWSATSHQTPDTYDKYDLFPNTVANTTFKNSSSTTPVYYNNNDTDNSTGWYVLTSTEWDYLYNKRKCSTVCGVANARYMRCRIGDQNGVVFFPDNYEHPVSVQELKGINQGGSNQIQLRVEEWEHMEEAGAAFIPAAGMYESYNTSHYRDLYHYHNTGACCWGSNNWWFLVRFNAEENETAHYNDFTSDSSNSGNQYIPVRLVKDI